MTRVLTICSAFALILGVAAFSAPTMACPGKTAASPATTALGDIDPAAPTPEPSPTPAAGG